MPLNTASEDSSRPGDALDSAPDADIGGWLLPLVRLGTARVYLSSTVLFAILVLAVVVAVFARQSGNADLPLVAVIGCTFWAGGWLIQLVVSWVAIWMFGLRSTNAVVHVTGVEMGRQPCSADKTLVIALAGLFALVSAGMLLWWIGGGLTMSSAALVPPGFGLRDSDSLSLGGAWLLWTQAICQMFPLPRTMGRQVLAALAFLSARQLDPSVQRVVARRCLVAVAMLTMFLAIALIAAEEVGSVPVWPLICVLAVMLWVSSRAGDVPQMLAGFRLAAGTGERLSAPPLDETEEPRFELVRVRASESRGSWLSTALRAFRVRRNRRRAKRALAEERQEATDVASMDEILQRLHTQGSSALSEDDRRTLQRVSRSIRRDRERDELPPAE